MTRSRLAPFDKNSSQYLATTTTDAHTPVDLAHFLERHDMALNTLHDLMTAELKDLYSAETQLVKALPKMAKGASTPALRSAFEAHLSETKTHVSRLEQIFEMIDARPRGKKCKGMEGLLEEGGEMLEEEGEDSVRDAGLIASARRVEHYEIAAYGSTIAIAEQMKHSDVVAILRQTLDEEMRCDETLSSLAVDEVNPAAPGMDDDESDMEPAAAAPRSNGKAKTAARR
jgi:ferritin-like metal-binding protein YciE